MHTNLKHTLIFVGGAACGIVATEIALINFALNSKHCKEILTKHIIDKFDEMLWDNKNKSASKSDAIILSTRKEAETIMEHINEVLNKYKIVTVADLYGLVGLPSKYTDVKYGWTSSKGFKIKRCREGYRITYPKATSVE